MTLTKEVLSAALEQLFGASIQDIQAALNAAVEVQELSPVVKEQWRNQQLSTLREAWGEDFDGVYNHIVEKVFPSLSPQEQAMYNNADGLLLLGQRYRPQIEQALVASKEPASPVPTEPTSTNGFLKSQATTATAQQPQYRQSQLLSMSDEDYAAQRADIEAAYQAGAVEMDI